MNYYYRVGPGRFCPDPEKKLIHTDTQLFII